MIFDSIRQMRKQLAQLDKWLDMTTAYAQTRSFDPNVLMTFRLAPDQFAFARQVQTACDTAKTACARLTGREAPKHPDDETTIAALQTRVRSVIEWLDGFTAKDFEGAEARVITTPRWEGKVMSGADYFREHATPNFYFHLTHTYAMLRNNGIPLGKKDYLGTISLRDP